MVVGHVAPEAPVGGPIALVEKGDSITIDAGARLLQLDVSDKELERRRKEWAPSRPRYVSGVLAKYARLVSSSSTGAVTGRPKTDFRFLFDYQSVLTPATYEQR